jgi:hypothetical protein
VAPIKAPEPKLCMQSTAAHDIKRKMPFKLLRRQCLAGRPPGLGRGTYGSIHAHFSIGHIPWISLNILHPTICQAGQLKGLSKHTPRPAATSICQPSRLALGYDVNPLTIQNRRGGHPAEIKLAARSMRAVCVRMRPLSSPVLSFLDWWTKTLTVQRPNDRGPGRSHEACCAVLRAVEPLFLGSLRGGSES